MRIVRRPTPTRASGSPSWREESERDRQRNDRIVRHNRAFSKMVRVSEAAARLVSFVEGFGFRLLYNGYEIRNHDTYKLGCSCSVWIALGEEELRPTNC